MIPNPAQDIKAANRSVKVGIFIPAAEDSSNAVVNYLAQKLVEDTDSIDLVIFRVKQRPRPEIKEVPELYKRYLLHSRLLRDVIFPFQEERGLAGNPEGVLLSPVLLAQKYSDRITIEDVTDLNDPTLVKRVKEDQSLKMGFSVRNFEIFRKPLISAFQDKMDYSLINIHPAKLPGIRGLDGPFWTRKMGNSQYTTTMHVVDAGIDTGPVIDSIMKSVNGGTNKSVASYTRDVAPEVADMIYREINLRLVAGGIRSPISHQAGESIYRTIPTRDQIKEGEEEGINFDSRQDQLAYLTTKYSHPSAEGKKLKDHYGQLMTKLYDFYHEHKPTGLDETPIVLPQQLHKPQFQLQPQSLEP